jgi:hypothetical protein
LYSFISRAKGMSPSEWAHRARTISCLFMMIEAWVLDPSSYPLSSFSSEPVEVGPEYHLPNLVLRRKAYSRHRGQPPLSEPHPDACGQCVAECKAAIDSLLPLDRSLSADLERFSACLKMTDLKGICYVWHVKFVM